MLQRGMTSSYSAFPGLSDQELLETVKRLADDERHATTALVQSLMELDARRLYLGEGSPSLFAYCTQVLRLSEHAAYNRIEVARAGRRHPRLLDALEEGAITLTAARLVGPHLTPENCDAVLRAARYRTKRQIEQLVASLRPLPDAPALVRSPSSPPAPPRHSTGSTPAAPPLQELEVASGTDAGRQPAGARTPPRPSVAPLAPARYRIQFTTTQFTHDKLRRAQDLLRHVVPDGDPAEIVDRALTLLVKELERLRLATVVNPRPARPVSPGSRHIPSEVKRAVWRRDEGRCAFIGSRGRCPEIGFLEWHHVRPFAMGGSATVENIQLRCRAHNAFEAALLFGDLAREGVTERPTSG